MTDEEKLNPARAYAEQKPGDIPCIVADLTDLMYAIIERETPGTSEKRRDELRCMIAFKQGCITGSLWALKP